MRFLVVLATLLAAMLGGCSKSEEEAKADLRTRFVAQCNTGMGAKLKEKGLDPERFCACSVDSMMKGRTAAEITKMDTDGVGTDEAGARAASECITQQQAAAATPSAAPVSEPAAAPAAEETDTEAE